MRPSRTERARRIVSCCLLVAVSLVFTHAAVAADPTPWPVSGKLLGKQGKKAKDVSGIACSATDGLPRMCLLVDDEAQGAQIVIVKEGEVVAGEFIPLIDDMFAGEPLELDGEGVGFADGSFYVIGSHGHPRDKNKKLDKVKDAAKIAASINASSQVIRLRFAPQAVGEDGGLKAAPNITRSAELAKLLAANATLQPFVNQRLDENGLTIEGVAVRNGRLYAAMRAPLLDGNEVAILSVALRALFDGAPADPKLDRLGLEAGRGIRDLVAFDGGFLVLAGPSAEAKGTYSLYFWDGGNKPKPLADLPTLTDDDGDQLKAEAVLPLDRSATKLRVLVFFDGAKEGAPRPIEISYP
jgi:hypothetical protein